MLESVPKTFASTLLQHGRGNCSVFLLACRLQTTMLCQTPRVFVLSSKVSVRSMFGNAHRNACRGFDFTYFHTLLLAIHWNASLLKEQIAVAGSFNCLVDCSCEDRAGNEGHTG